MRHIVLSEDGYNVSPHASLRLMAACYFPESVRDQTQAFLIAQIEQAEFQKVGEANYKPSEIFSFVAKALEKRTAQIYAAGFIAHAYLWLAASPYKPSLRRAAIIASYSANEIGKVSYRPALDPLGSDKVQPVTGDPDTLESIFRRYRSVAHICAARVSMSAYLEHAHIFDETPLVRDLFVQTSVSIQEAVEKATDTSTWNLWDLKPAYPSSLSGSPVLGPDDNLYGWIARGYHLALEEGKIVNKDAGGSSTSPG